MKVKAVAGSVFVPFFCVFLILSVLGSHAFNDSHTNASTQPSIVTVQGTQLIIQRRLPDGSLDIPRPYTIKGVNWSPGSIGTKVDPGNGIDERPAEFAKWYETDIPLMAKMGVNTVRTFADFGVEVTATKILDTLYEHGIMVILPVDQLIANQAHITPTINAYKNHPAILMWYAGNEWDLNLHYGTSTSIENAASFTEEAAQIMHGLDSNHPVSSILGDIHRGVYRPLHPLPWSSNLSIEEIVNDYVPSVDIWGVNIYRGASFGGLFGEWLQISDKPLYVSEFGADAYDHRMSSENEPMQAVFDKTLWHEIWLNLTYEWPERPAVGGLVFEWNDEWWKNGNPNSHDVTSELNPGQPDGYNDEEWFGLVDILREPRSAYYQVKYVYEAPGSITSTQAITLAGTSEVYSLFERNDAGICFRQGMEHGGRGINVTYINPQINRVEDCRNFDTFYNRDNFQQLINYLNAIPSGSIVLLAIADEGGFINDNIAGCHTPYTDSRVQQAYDALEGFGSTQIRNVGFRGSWVMIYVQGHGKLVEGANDPTYTNPATSCLTSARNSTEVSTPLMVTTMCPHNYLLYLPVKNKAQN